jgi:hypothetical protein
MSEGVPDRRRAGHHVPVTVLDISQHRARSPRGWRPVPDAVRHAVVVSGWSGIVLPEIKVLGAVVYPVVELTGARSRIQVGIGPQQCLAVLEMWEVWAQSAGDAARRLSDSPPAPLRITGFVSASRPWHRALSDLFAVAGLGAGMLVRSRKPTALHLMEADASDVWAVTADPSRNATVWVAGRHGPVATASRVPATRLIEEGLFAHALDAGYLV